MTSGRANAVAFAKRFTSAAKPARSRSDSAPLWSVPFCFKSWKGASKSWQFGIQRA